MDKPIKTQQQNILELYRKTLNILYINMSSSSLPSIPKIKNKFTEILTKPELSSLPTTSPSDFIPVITKTSFLKPKTESLHIPTTDLVEYYNKMFPTLDTYQNFINQKLHLWYSHLELKYFNSMY